MNRHGLLITPTLVLLAACSRGPQAPAASTSEPTFSEPAALLGTWASPKLAHRTIPGVLTFGIPNAFTLTVSEVAVSDGPNGPTYTPYRVTVSGRFQASGDRLILTPTETSGPEHYRVAATRLFGLDRPGTPAIFTFQVIGQQLRLAGPDHTALVFSRKASGRGV